MVLTKDELVGSLKHEVRILLHLASKVDPAKLDYRPTAKQRSTLELLQYAATDRGSSPQNPAGMRMEGAGPVASNLPGATSKMPASAPQA